MAGEANGALPQEVKSLFDSLQSALAANRTKTEELEKQVKKGGEDAVTKAEWKKTNDAFEEIKSEINGIYKKINRERQTGAPAVDAKAAALEAKANHEFGRWSTPSGQAIDLSKAAAERKAYAEASLRMLRIGEKALTADETKTLSVGSAPDGGFFIEPARSDQIITRLRETSDMRSIASVMSISAPSLKIPIDRDDVGYEWVGEQSTRNATSTPQVAEMEIPVHEISAMPKITQNMLDDAGFDVEGWLNGKISDRFGRAENSAFVTGNGTNKPRGFLDYPIATTADATRAFGTLQYKATGSSGAFKTGSASVSPADDLLDLIYMFNAGYRANLTWAMNKTVLGTVRKFKDQNGNFIYDPRLGANGIVDMVLNYPVKEFSDMPNLGADSRSVALGDFRRGYLIVDRQGIRQLRDPFTDKPRVLVYTTKRVGGAVVDSDAIKLLKFGSS